MWLPVLIIAAALGAGGVVAYGTDPAWAQYDRGLDFILWSRRLQWPLVALSLGLCVSLIGMIASGRRRAWWLIGLGPVLALFVHRFVRDPLRGLSVAENPPLEAAERARHVQSEDHVVGVLFNGNAYAYPYSALFANPVIVQSDHDKRMVLMWSAFANRAVACSVRREVRARHLEIVSFPANALLLLDRRTGQFINGLTGATPAGQRPAGFASPLPTWKMTWRQWQAAHPRTQVLRITDPRLREVWPTAPLRPRFPLPRGRAVPEPEKRIVLAATTRPLAFVADQLPARPANVRSGLTAVLVFRDPQTRELRLFDREVQPDLFATFRRGTDSRRPGAFLIDTDTNSGWSADGRAVDGPCARQHKKLAPIAWEDGLPWGVMKAWYPGLELTKLE